ncbi:molecular chaperone DnaK [Cryobacterium sp. TMT1-3]|uniref:Molecular chaperone DnaK n=1 Tax=Cryobacterium luteum TaxID=1424661 RepID=A0A1H8ISA8_9MICO|nr:MULTISPECIES: TraR/DksA C4-type zinc finger protein [Cryobacterium]TFB91128.1 molecular chaperone DnaK [Cryobacterium luteum]TFC28160.1 molecular chaperone DnaK [Cryobacterium sp. TMT1-3]SEN71444.1 transcriptional regulator, TraR/DksA family [Cryobacterium luteum]
MSASPFDAAQLHVFETALGERRLELTVEFQRLADTFDGVQSSRSDGSADGAHDAEASSLRTEWSRMSGFQGEAVEELASIDRALQRIVDGKYGLCVRGGERIPDGRLEIKPAADLCIACAEKAAARRR